MALRLMPDVEALVVAYLKAHTSISAIVGSRVGTALDDGLPRVKATLITGREIIADHFDEQQIQLDCIAASSVDASLLARTVRAALNEMPATAHTRGVVTGVRTISTPRWFPDDTVTPPRPRYLLEVGVMVHPHPL